MSGSSSNVGVVGKLALGLIATTLCAGALAYKYTPSEYRNIDLWVNRTPIEFTFEICNVAAYNARYFVATPRPTSEFNSENVNSVSGIEQRYLKFVRNYAGDYTSLRFHAPKIVRSGECETLVEKFRSGRERFFYFAEPVSEQDAVFANWYANQGLLSDDNAANDSSVFEWPGTIMWPSKFEIFSTERPSATGDVVHNVSIPRCDFYSKETEKYAPPNTSNNLLVLNDGDPEIAFGCAKPFTATSFRAVIEAPNMHFAQRINGEIEHSLSSALSKAKSAKYEIEYTKQEMARLETEKKSALKQQEKFRREFGNKSMPYLIGSFADPNGPEEKGILLVEQQDFDIYGVRNPNLRNKWITKVNNIPIYGIENFQSALMRHAESLSGGVEVPLLIEAYNGKHFSTHEFRFFFNTYVFGTNWERAASYYGFLDASTFGAGATANCAGSNVMRLAGNLGSGLLDGLDSMINERSFDDRSLRTFDYEDMQSCRWREIQRKGIARQLHSDQYEDAAILAIFAPGGARTLLGKGAKAKAATVLGKGRLSRAVSIGALELVETVGYDMGTAPPGTPLIKRFRDAKTSAILGGSVGFATGLILPGK